MATLSRTIDRFVSAQHAEPICSLCEITEDFWSVNSHLHNAIKAEDQDAIAFYQGALIRHASY